MSHQATDRQDSKDTMVTGGTKKSVSKKGYIVITTFALALLVGGSWFGWQQYQKNDANAAVSYCNTSPATDVATSNQFCNAIGYIKGKNIIANYADGSFRPSETITRGAMAQILNDFAVPATGSYPQSFVQCPQVFTDVPATQGPYHNGCPINWMKSAGITTGYGDGSFHPSSQATREATAAFLYRIANPGKAMPACATPPFNDVATSSAFCGAITWMKQQGITSGYSDGSFHPSDSITREATAAFLYNLARKSDNTLPAIGTAIPPKAVAASPAAPKSKTPAPKSTTAPKSKAATPAKPSASRTVAIAESATQDGCGSNAMHRASDRKTHVGQNDYGQGSVCVCSNGHPPVPYWRATSLPDSKHNTGCDKAISSSNTRGSAGPTTNSANKSSAGYTGDGCGANANRSGSGCVCMYGGGPTGFPGIGNDTNNSGCKAANGTVCTRYTYTDRGCSGYPASSSSSSAIKPQGQVSCANSYHAGCKCSGAYVDDGSGNCVSQSAMCLHNGLTADCKKPSPSANTNSGGTGLIKSIFGPPKCNSFGLPSGCKPVTICSIQLMCSLPGTFTPPASNTRGSSNGLRAI